MQKTGYIYKRNGWWVLRFREVVNQAGALKIVQRAERLVPVSNQFRTKSSVAMHAADRLKEINRWNQNSEKVITVADFVDRIFLPHVTEQRRPSTAKNASDIWKTHLEPRIAKELLRDLRTHHVKRLLDEIAAQDKHPKTGEPLRRESLKRIKSCLSAMFKHAKNMAFFEGVNPATDAEIPGKAPGGQATFAYSMPEIERMLQVLLNPTAQVIVATAGYSGLRRGELEGLRWEDWHDGALWVSRSVWNGHVNEPKTQASAAPVPVITSLADRLTAYRKYLGSPATGPMFPGARDGKALSLNNVLNRDIKPVLNRCATCGKSAGKAHLKADHKFVRDTRLPQWRGWHAFRRGVATNLHALGVDDKTIQSTLRHSSVNVTQRCYIKSLPSQTKAAMDRLENAISAERTAACAPDCAQEPAAENTVNRVN
jgi:integrase